MSSFETVLERVYTIPFYPKLNSIPRNKRAPRAMRLIKEFIARHVKSDDIIISEEVNEKIWERGIQKPPRKITVRVVKSDDDVVEVYLVDTSITKDFETTEIPASREPSEAEIDEEDFDEDED
ncbi:MAG: 50S ribosomal protein L31e [Candidatus Heimdallarchaeota archaeon]|nr:50S ribosomal protein L31e [Candidatus Heimdallarchaeota archaeon]